jgi:hypothetical protein
MAARDGNRVDGLVPQFIGELPEARFRQRPHIRRNLHLIKERCLAGSRHR